MPPRNDVGTWMKFYPTDWLASCTASGLSLAEQGAYMRLLCVAWERGGIPADTKRLARVVGASRQEFEEMWDVLSEKFEQHADNPSLLVNPRQEEVRDAQIKLHRSRRSAGRAGAGARWQADGKPDGKANGKPDGNGMEDSGLRTQGSGIQGAGRACAREALRAATLTAPWAEFFGVCLDRGGVGADGLVPDTADGWEILARRLQGKEVHLEAALEEWLVDGVAREKTLRSFLEQARAPKATKATGLDELERFGRGGGA